MRISVRSAFVPALALALTLSAQSAPVRFKGDAVLRSIDAKRVAILLDTNGDRTIDHGFLLSSDLPIAADLAVLCPEASVDFTDGWARVASDKRIYDLYVAGYPEPPAAPADSQAHQYTGYALVHSSGSSGCDLQKALEGDARDCFRYGNE
jgi:hypothetical protein